jgi:aspartyl/asparaginyl beta-hydroxylase (cupin superfamily)
MTITHNKMLPWLSDDNAPYAHTEPGIYDPKDFPWVGYVESHWETIRDELLSVLKGNENYLDPYPDLTKTNKKDVWKTTGLIYWTLKSPRNIRNFPKTWAIMRKLPNLTACSLNKLEPQSTIKPHVGDTNAMFRCHMGLVIPAQAPKCGLRVGKEITCWEEGKVLMFNDAYEHTAWNNTDNVRYIISFDVMRPEFEKKGHWTASQVLGKIFVEVVYQHQAWLRRYFSAEWKQRLLTKCSKFLFYVAIVTRARLHRNL